VGLALVALELYGVVCSPISIEGALLRNMWCSSNTESGQLGSWNLRLRCVCQLRILSLSEEIGEGAYEESSGDH
jgi:hypothetical protein